jgi:hypothetical protein
MLFKMFFGFRESNVIFFDPYNVEQLLIIIYKMKNDSIKPGPKPKKQDGTLDKRRRDNKNTPGNKPSLKPSKSTKNK